MRAGRPTYPPLAKRVVLLRLQIWLLHDFRSDDEYNYDNDTKRWQEWECDEWWGKEKRKWEHDNEGWQWAVKKRLRVTVIVSGNKEWGRVQEIKCFRKNTTSVLIITDVNDHLHNIYFIKTDVKRNKQHRFWQNRC